MNIGNENPFQNIAQMLLKKLVSVILKQQQKEKLKCSQRLDNLPH